ncbi:hypothetical protein BO86DRAFT_83332 [Aspergillus japonicus CBS 114.51]|uniref:Zn(2)-C6 fungal-type domain-containing protein n=1 Tax=Aspergillus japonicus CBS 114.51 TaxID=1448312 RepID=A0A8T8X3E6_ASPJA|nr:hypothetical protein BO86DRAFT_83332 [Aspergillus japonicus CBS 114.51]RAH82460.1 hypothetical protein BO86DRAFT_83332 [Aspergillus japonicus CBS 114.51]
MISRQPACEPCRKSKLACDHTHPVCTRCRTSNRAGLCLYRSTPFKRKRPLTSNESTEESRSSPSHDPFSTPSARSSRRQRYPNPGYIGSSSHVAIFSHIPPTAADQTVAQQSAGTTSPSTTVDMDDDDVLLQRAADATRLLLAHAPLQSMKDLVKLWLSSGASLALGGAWLVAAIDSIDLALTSISTNANWHRQYAELLLSNSAQSLHSDSFMTFAEFCAQFTEHNIRWETLGLFALAVIRASYDVSYFAPLYSKDNGPYDLRKRCFRVANCALEIALSLDQLNDLQLVLQYENLIVHSYIAGDQSYQYWRRLGDGIASIFALGYHQTNGLERKAPAFLQELRRTAFARIFSADKNMAIFLGRPPRMPRHFCDFQIPSAPAGTRHWELSSDPSESTPGWSPAAVPSYVAESRWSALCASLKEDILYLHRDKNGDQFQQQVRTIQAQAERLWDELPRQFRLEGTLKEVTKDGFERDFLASFQLNHLHVLFLLRLVVLPSPATPSQELVTLAEQILATVVALLMLRDQLTNSGTSLMWKIVHYGLPAAGIILLAVLNQRCSSAPVPAPHPRAIQNLTVLAAELSGGSVVQLQDPNYDLISKALSTIHNMLDSITADALRGPGAPSPRTTTLADWEEFQSQLSWDLDLGFWQNLADTPFLGD